MPDTPIEEFADHPVHKLMSRAGSFPLHVAFSLLKRYAVKGNKILDPFCGKGTSLFAARSTSCEAYGLDIAPEAVACSQAKMQDVDLSNLRSYIGELRLGRPSLSKVPDPVRVFFEDSTLAQILSIRRILLKDINSSDNDVRSCATFTLATLLGILHGHASYSLSIESAHAFSMAPNYVKNYALKNGTKSPKRDVRSCLVKKMKRCLSAPMPAPVNYRVALGQASESSMIFANLRNRIDVVLTSPPYLNAQTYAKDNSLRLWLLGFDYKDLRSDYIQTSSLKTYELKMREVLHQMWQLLRPNGILICIGGNVRRSFRTKEGIRKETFNTGEFLAHLCQDSDLGFILEDFTEHKVPSTSRYYHSLNRTNGHAAKDLKETIFVARKNSTKHEQEKK